MCVTSAHGNGGTDGSGSDLVEDGTELGFRVSRGASVVTRNIVGVPPGR